MWTLCSQESQSTKCSFQSESQAGLERPVVMMPLRVYLDYSDFSTLANANRTAEQDNIRRQLTMWAEEGLVQFVFSGAHLIEMAPLDACYTPAAVARADLLVSLCHRNAVISFDRLILAELNCLQDPELPAPKVISTSAEWYPEVGNLVSPVQWVDAMKEVDVTSKEIGLNRQQRRQLKRKFFKNGQPTKATRRFLQFNEQSADYKELIEQYPMRLQDAKVLGQYTVGKATAAQANEAFLESLRDPRWMMQWFANHYAKLSTFSQWLRAPAEKLLAAVTDIAEAARRIHELGSIIGPSHKPYLTSEYWERQQDEILCSIARRLLEVHSPGAHFDVIAGDIDERCPGLSTFFRTAHSAVRDVTGRTPRQPKASDFADGVHAMYAPYVDVFRADSYMANHVRICVQRHGTMVVPKLSQLVPVIKNCLNI